MISHAKRLMKFNTMIDDSIIIIRRMDFKIIIVAYIILMNINSTMTLAKDEMTLGDACWPARAEIFCVHADLPLLQCLSVVNANKMIDACMRGKTIRNKTMFDECLIIMRHRSDKLLEVLQQIGLHSVNECRNHFDDPMLILGCTQVVACTDSENLR